MRIRIKAGDLVLMNLGALELFRCEVYTGRAELAPAHPLIEDLTVEIELEPADQVLAADALDVPRVKPSSTLCRRLVAEIPARGPFDDADD